MYLEHIIIKDKKYLLLKQYILEQEIQEAKKQTQEISKFVHTSDKLITQFPDHVSRSVELDTIIKRKTEKLKVIRDLLGSSDNV